MAHAMASMAGLRGSSQAVLDGSLHISSPNRLVGPSSVRIVVARSGLTVKAQAQQQQPESSRRAMLGLVAAGIAAGSLIQTQAALADARSIPIGPAPAPSGGLPGTLNSDEARDLKLPLNKRFYLQPQTPAEAAQRAKEVAKDIVNVKTLIDKKAWPYVRDDLRLRAEYLRFDLNTVINSKPKDEKKSLKELTNKLFSDLNNLDYAAKIKSPSQAEKYYADTVSSLNDVLSKIA